MVDGIIAGGGASVAAPVVRTGQVAATTPVAPPSPAPASAPAPSDASQLAALAKAVAANAPVDTDRVEQIKTAIANGTFPILPATIADQMLSFRYEWMSHDPQSHD